MANLINQSFEAMLELAASAIESDMRRPKKSGEAPVAVLPRPPAKPPRDCARMIPVPSVPAEENPAAAAWEESPVRPRRRPPVPVLTVLDDGSYETGQDIRIRTDGFMIGRTHGDLLIPNDTTLSARHAELRLTQHGEAHVWTLHDLESSNRVFVRVQSAVLTPDMVVMLGTRRFQLRPGSTGNPEPPAQPSPGMTFQIPIQAPPQSHDTLVELPGRPWQSQFPLTSERILIGRDASQCGIQIDDPTLAPAHAELIRQPDGLWQLRARPSKNGIWVSIQSVRLTNLCFFQCGEQRFRFMLP